MLSRPATETRAFFSIGQVAPGETARMVRMPENAPVTVLLFLLTLAVLAAATALLLWSLGRKRPRQARRILEGMAVLVVVYAGTLLTFSLTSPERILEPGQQKYLC